MKNTRIIYAWFEHKLIIKASKFYYILLYLNMYRPIFHRSSNVSYIRFVFFSPFKEEKIVLRILPLFLSVHVKLVPATFCDISRHITTNAPTPPPKKKNPFNFLVSFLLWIWRLIFARSKPRLIVCIIYRRCRIFERKQPSGPRHWRWKETLFKHLTTKKQIPPFDSQLVFCVTLVPPVIDLS